MRYDDLSALSPVVRKEVLSGELSRRLKSMDSVSGNEIDAVVESIVSLSLIVVCSAFRGMGILGKAADRPDRPAGVIHERRTDGAEREV